VKNLYVSHVVRRDHLLNPRHDSLTDELKLRGPYCQRILPSHRDIQHALGRLLAIVTCLDP